MPGPIQLIFILFFIGLFMLYLRFLISLFKSSINPLTKGLWIVVAFALPVLGVLLYYALNDRIELKTT